MEGGTSDCSAVPGDPARPPAVVEPKSAVTEVPMLLVLGSSIPWEV